MSTKSVDSEDNENSNEEVFYSDSSTSSEEEKNHIKKEECLNDKDVKDIKTMRNGQLKTSKSTESGKSDKYSNEYSEVDVKLIVGHDSINLHLNEEMEMQDVIDIVGDMFGLLDNYLSLEMNGELVKPGMKLKLLAENNRLELKVVFCNEDDVKSVVINRESTEYIHKNLKEFSHASIQTNPRVQLWSRETQTPCFPLTDRSTNTAHTKSVQSDLTVKPTDKILSVQNYVPYDNLVIYQNEQAIKIQKCIRRFLAQKRIIRMKKERDIAILKKRLQAEEISFAELQDKIKDIMNKRPVLLRDDFAKAHSLLEDWLSREKIKILKEKSGKNQRVALGQLFAKKMECLHYIQKCRMITKSENEYKLKLKQLNQMPDTTSSLNTKGYTNENEISQNAENFKKLYNNLRRHDVIKEERIKCLNTLKEFLENMKAPECTNEMITLIDREIQMMAMGLKNSSLEGSRKRLEELFLYLSTDPEFNPGSIASQAENVTLFQCRTCKELKPPEKFSVDLLKGLSHCSMCTLRKELNQSNMIMTPYKRMIQQIHNDEMNKGSREGYVQLLQPSGLHYLVQRIWQGRSCLSEEDDLESLRFIRWDKNYPWSPWNCILLTENESELHQAIEDIDNFYGKHFLKKIENKHMQAKMKFSDLEELNRRIKTPEYKINSRQKLPQENQLISTIINPRTKKLQTNCVLKEPISDLVFPHCCNL